MEMLLDELQGVRYARPRSRPVYHRRLRFLSPVSGSTTALIRCVVFAPSCSDVLGEYASFLGTRRTLSLIVLDQSGLARIPLLLTSSTVSVLFFSVFSTLQHYVMYPGIELGAYGVFFYLCIIGIVTSGRVLNHLDNPGV